MKITWRLHWSRTCWYGFCPNEKVWEKERKRVLKKHHLDIGDYPSTPGMTTCYKTPDARALVTLDAELDTDPIRLVGVIAHEALHISDMSFRQMQEDMPGEETAAYNIGQIASHIFESYSLTRGNKLKELANA